jgi:hypothetical protein
MFIGFIRQSMPVTHEQRKRLPSSHDVKTTDLLGGIVGARRRGNGDSEE